MDWLAAYALKMLNVKAVNATDFLNFRGARMQNGAKTENASLKRI